MASTNTTKALMLCAMTMVLVLVAMVDEAAGTPICNTDTSDLEQCRPAVTGNDPPAPSAKCCQVIRGVDLACLCQYKSALPALGIQTKNALALPAKCGLKNTPPQCKA